MVPARFSAEAMVVLIQNTRTAMTPEARSIQRFIIGTSPFFLSDLFLDRNALSMRMDEMIYIKLLSNMADDFIMCVKEVD
jgi:hypothetical protein